MSNSNADIHWVEFKLVDVFDVVNTKSILKEQIVPDSGSIPYVTAGESNNAVTTYIDCPEEWIDKGGCVLIGGKTMVVTYQKDDFCSNDSHNLALYLKDKNIVPDEKVFLFLVTVIKKALGKKYAWGDSISSKKIQKDVIQLPVDSTGKIARDYMQERIAGLKQECIAELEAYLKVTGLNDYKLTESDKQVLSEQVIWKEFRIGELFDIFTGRDVIIGRVKNGSIPLISHQNTDNGIVKYIEHLADRRLFDCTKTISLADRGMFWASVQDEDFHIGTRVKALVLKDDGISKEVLLFLATAINKLQVMFTEYLVNATDKLPDLLINIPVNRDGRPDYEFMERYIRAIEKVTIANTVKWKDKVVATTKSII